MWEIVEGFHKALRIESTLAFVLVIAVGSAVVGGIVAWVIDAGYRNSPEYKAEHSPKIQAVAMPNPAPSASATVTTPLAPPPATATQRTKKGTTTKPKPAGVTIKQQGQTNSTIGGNVTQGPCSAIVNGGTGNQAIANCEPPQRFLNDKQKQGFRSMLAALPRGVHISVSSVGTDEAANYGFEFYQLMTPDHGSSWTRSVLPPQATDKGVWLQINEQDEPLARQIISELKNAGIEIDHRVAVNPSLKHGQMQLIIGSP